MNNYSYINLSDYFNHKIIYKNGVLINYTEGINSKFYDDSTLPESLKTLYVNKIPFIFPEKQFNKYDNLICEEQKINTPKNNFSHINFLGISDNEFSFDKIKILYTDGSSEYSDISFLNWFEKECWNSISNVNDLCKVGIECKDEIGLKKYIHICTSNIKNYDKKLDYIILPDNPIIHIFSITLTHVM